MGVATAAQLITQPERGHTVGTRVRTTITPGEVIEVDDAELVDLERQGLIESREGDDGFVDDEPIEVESGVITDAGNGPDDEQGKAPELVDPPKPGKPAKGAPSADETKGESA